LSKTSTHIEGERITLFADILLPVPVPGHYTYRVPNEWQDLVTRGSRVIAQFGPKKILTGVVVKVHEDPPSDYEAKYLLEILDEQPVVTDHQLALFEWMADYYMSPEGQVLHIALPSGLKLSSQSKIQLNPDFDAQHQIYPLSEEEQKIIEAVTQQESMDYDQVQETVGQGSVHKWIKSLLYKNAILLFEEVKEKYQPKKQKRIRLQPEYLQKENLEALFDQLQKKEAQSNLLLKYLQQIPVFNEEHLNSTGISKKELLGGDISASSLKTLIKKEVLEEFEINVSRFPESNNNPISNIELSPVQTQVRDQILGLFQQKEIVLFHGITGSGKTEIYIDLIQKVIESGSQVLYLLPEIALTTQIVSRLQRVFGAQMGVYHSRFSDNERVEVWRGVLSGRFQLVVGVRSSVLLPFDNLGMVIVDEEHEASYKQFDPAPRYHAKDVALVLARLHHAKTLLGSATPSIESYFNAQQDKYGLVQLTERFGEVALPEFTLINTAKAQLKKRMNGVFSQHLLEAIQETLAQDKQVIVFQNRRGYAPYSQCQTCGNIPQCPNCSVSLTYHMHYHQLRCHYCGYREKLVTNCTQCNSSDQELKGFGTEKLEEDIKGIFPNARVQRMDLDTTRRKYSYQQIIDRFEQQNIDILIGTQMVTKGLDFDHVDLVAVLDIDRIVHFPDFRSYERAYQLITQVAGRAGRKSGQGKVLVQTKNPGHHLLQLITQQNYQQFYHQEIQERKQYKYPPFVRFIRLVVKSNERDQSLEAAKAFGATLVQGIGRERVLGPQEPLISKIRNQYLMELYVKLEKQPQLVKQVKQKILETIQGFRKNRNFKGIRFLIDVDPN